MSLSSFSNQERLVPGHMAANLALTNLATAVASFVSTGGNMAGTIKDKGRSRAGAKNGGGLS